MKKRTLAVFAIFIVLVTPVNAQVVETTTTPTATPVSATPAESRRTAVLTQAAGRKSAVLTQGAARKEASASKAAERKSESEENKMENLRARAVKQIDNRVKAMNLLITRINNLKKLSDTQKAALVTQVQTEVTNLTTLKAKIQADTDLATLQADVKSIVSSYRIYALFIPKIYLLTGAERTLSAGEKMTTAYNELKTRVEAFKAADVDTTEMDAILAAMLAKISDSTVQANAAIATVTPLTPDGYPGNKTSLDAARENLKTAKADLRDAKLQGHSLLKLLRETTLPVTTLTPSANSEASPTPTTP